MSQPSPALSRGLAQLQDLVAQLEARRAELAAQLQAAAGTALHAADAPAEVADFKDAAGLAADEAVTDVATEHAVHELADVTAALRRIAEGSYGLCRECGEAIGPQRLHAMPAAALCLACQSDLEAAASRQ